MNVPGEERDNFAAAVATVVLAVAVAFPAALVVAACSWWWRGARARDWQSSAWLLLVSAAALVVAALAFLGGYPADWLDVVRTVADGRPLDEPAALARMLALSTPLGLLIGMFARDAFIARRQRHPIEGRSVREAEDERDRRHRARTGLARCVPTVIDGSPVIGVWLDGEPGDGWRKRNLLTLPEGASHVVAIGATGAGKTHTILRLAAAHLALGWRVVVIDAKEDYDTAVKFREVAQQSGIGEDRIRTWPSAGPVDLFRGSVSAIRDRLMACAGYTEPYYRAVAATLLTLVTDADPPPRALADVLSRLDHNALKARWAGTDRSAIAAGLKADDVQGVRYRYFDLERQLVSLGAVAQVPGGWSWEDADAAWVTLPTSTRADAAAALGRALLVDLIGYFRDPTRRDERPVLLVVEELGAIVSGDPDTARLVIEAFERARSARVRTIVSVQTPEGLGPPADQARILHSGAAVLAHRMPAPEAVANLLGTRYGLEASLGVDRHGRLLHSGSLREQSQFVLSPDTLRRLPVGEAVFIHGHQWSQVAVPRDIR